MIAIEFLYCFFVRKGLCMSKKSTQKLYILTDQFYEDYPIKLFPEMMTPHGNRVYNCILIKCNDFLMCIPFRSYMNHNNGYSFKTTARSRMKKSGLDYSKMVIISLADDTKYLSNKNAFVDNDEYRETMINSKKIESGAFKYLNDYIKHHNLTKCLNPKEYRRRYGYSTLPYFNEILDIK